MTHSRFEISNLGDFCVIKYFYYVHKQELLENNFAVPCTPGLGNYLA